jgi:hypothetical protein
LENPLSGRSPGGQQDNAQHGDDEAREELNIGKESSTRCEHPQATCSVQPCAPSLPQDSLSFPFHVVMKVIAYGQPRPVSFAVCGRLTPGELVLSGPSGDTGELDFGECVIGERRGLRVSVYNPSALPQDLAFGRRTGSSTAEWMLPPGISIEPGEGFMRILPGDFTVPITGFPGSNPGH